MTAESNKLWKPDRDVRLHLEHGRWKLRKQELMTAGCLREVDCKHCGRPILLHFTNHGARLLTPGGSNHECAASRKSGLAKKTPGDES